MRDRTEYEWDIESVDKHGDILDHDFSEKLSPLKNHASDPVDLWVKKAVRKDLCLVRTIWNDYEGVAHRAWAYVTDDGLPTEFDDGHPVPKRFFKEFANNKDWVQS